MDGLESCGCAEDDLASQSDISDRTGPVRRMSLRQDEPASDSQRREPIAMPRDSLTIYNAGTTRTIVMAGEAPAQETPWEPVMALEFAPGKTRIGWIGTGVMGRRCAAI